MQLAKSYTNASRVRSIFQSARVKKRSYIRPNARSAQRIRFHTRLYNASVPLSLSLRSRALCLHICVSPEPYAARRLRHTP